MLVEMTRQAFNSLNDERLGWSCMEPTFLQIRGKDITVKSQVISQLTEGQQALCMFRVLYDHANNSVIEYYSWIAYLLDQPNYWSGVIGGLRFFGDISMLQLLEETKEVFEDSRRKLGIPWSNFTFKDLDKDKDLLQTISRLFEHFQEIAPDSLKRISMYIRSHPQDFVQIN